MYRTAIIGLGLIGGSLAYALRGFRGGELVGYDRDPAVMDAALKAGAVNRTAARAEDAVADADLCLFCAGPQGILEGVAACAGSFAPGAVVSEICGVKTELSRKIPALLPEGVRYIGIHPMAGKEVGGFCNADGALFRGAGFLIVPPEDWAPDALALLREVCVYAGAGRIVQNTPEEHDALIAYSSDLTHVSAAALVLNIPKGLTPAHTAGSFRDCTRVANIDPWLWTALLTENAAYLLPHLEAHIAHLQQFRDALGNGGGETLRALLQRAGDNKRRFQAL